MGRGCSRLVGARGEVLSGWGGQDVHQVLPWAAWQPGSAGLLQLMPLEVVARGGGSEMSPVDPSQTICSTGGWGPGSASSRVQGHQEPGVLSDGHRRWSRREAAGLGLGQLLLRMCSIAPGKLGRKQVCGNSAVEGVWRGWGRYGACPALSGVRRGRAETSIPQSSGSEKVQR